MNKRGFDGKKLLEGAKALIEKHGKTAAAPAPHRPGAGQEGLTDGPTVAREAAQAPRALTGQGLRKEPIFRF
jgi:hypothetical protein